MKTCNSNHPTEKALREIEIILERNNLTLEHFNGAFRLRNHATNERYEIYDMDIGDASTQLPRTTDGEKLIVTE